MAIQAQDLGESRDTVTLLESMRIWLADEAARNVADVAAMPPGPVAGRPPTEQQIQEFIAACQDQLDTTGAALTVELGKTSLLDCLSLALLLGQGHNGTSLASANSFCYEIEFIASCAAMIERGNKPNRRRATSALKVLCLSRRRSIAARYLEMALSWLGKESVQRDARRASTRT